MKYIHILLSMALVFCLTSFSATAGTPAEIKAADTPDKINGACVANNMIHKLAAAGDEVLVQRCLDNGVSPDLVEGNGWTPLHSAAFNGKRFVVIALLNHGANPLMEDKNGKTPLDLAVSKDHVRIAAILDASNTADEVADKPIKQLEITDSKTLKLAEALRSELNNYGPLSSNDSVDYEITEILHIQSESGSTDSVALTHKITVLFKIGEGPTDAVTYVSIISEDANGRFSVNKYDAI
ncbi:MAG: Unknown protein [uncultured Thiotrichaceae bacterium]|uniref:Uncharacterized protein n=1 Tax=uncultured Thiotrichaceae bacterium TaxID=298394 RepID=A0A6S6SCU7_9GAMM|nr:MAG: Unknown protein [uncultured Thiotrichaceae bacterium]